MDSVQRALENSKSKFSQLTDKERLADRQRASVPETVSPPTESKPIPESRATTLSTVERRIIKDSDQCPLCVNNNDPRKVPVHPNCHCDVITDSVETGVADPTSRLLSPLNQDLVDIVIGEDGGIVPEQLQLDPNTVAVFDPENVRWGDLIRWLEQVQPVLDQANTYVSIVVDEDADEAAEEIENVIDLLASDVEAGLEALQTKKFWFAIAKANI